MGFKRKFEIGDKVQVIKPNDFRYNQIGEIKYYYSSYNSKGVYGVSFENSTWNYYPNNLEKVENSNNTNTKSNKLSISDLKPGMKVRIRPDLKEGKNNSVFVNRSMITFNGTVHTIKKVNLDRTISLTDIPYDWDIDCFSEIIKESEEETTTSEEIKLPLKEGQIVTLLDGKKYQVIKSDTNKYSCELCSLYIKNCGECRCNITHIKDKSACSYVIPYKHYFKLCEDQNIENNSTKSLIFSDFKVEESNTDESYNSLNSVENSSVKEIGIITKVNFTLTDFKSEKLEHSKFTVL